MLARLATFVTLMVVTVSCSTDQVSAPKAGLHSGTARFDRAAESMAASASFRFPIDLTDLNPSLEVMTQTYGTYNGVVANEYHTGWDIRRRGTSQQAVVRAVGTGTVITVQANGARNCKAIGPCPDHGFGNTVIMKFTGPVDDGTANGVSPVYVQYSHLQNFDAAIFAMCGWPAGDPPAGRTCTPNADVQQGAALGVMGGSGDGSPAKWVVHLHLEVKNVPGLRGADTQGFGYTIKPPDSAGYLDPVLLFHSITTLSQPTPITLPKGTSLFIGPGVLPAPVQSRRYRLARNVDSQGQYYVSRTFGGSAGCAAGWSQVSLPGHARFYDVGVGAQLEEAWACVSSAPPPPTQTTCQTQLDFGYWFAPAHGATMTNGAMDIAWAIKPPYNDGRVASSIQVDVYDSTCAQVAAYQFKNPFSWTPGSATFTPGATNYAIRLSPSGQIQVIEQGRVWPCGTGCNPNPLPSQLLRADYSYGVYLDIDGGASGFRSESFTLPGTPAWGSVTVTGAGLPSTGIYYSPNNQITGPNGYSSGQFMIGPTAPRTFSLPAGTYTIQWGTANCSIGCLPDSYAASPPTSTVTISASQPNQTVTGNYVVSSGTLQINPIGIPAGCTISVGISGPQGLLGTGTPVLVGTPFVMHGLLTGMYTIDWGANQYCPNNRATYHPNQQVSGPFNLPPSGIPTVVSMTFH